MSTKLINLVLVVRYSLLARDFNNLFRSEITERTGLTLKSFGTVRHSAVIEKMAMLDMNDEIRIVRQIAGHSHCSSYRGERSASIAHITIQGSAICFASYIVNAADVTRKSITQVLPMTHTSSLLPSTPTVNRQN